MKPEIRQRIRDLLDRDIDDYKSNSVYCRGRIRFNFQINTTVDYENPFKREDLNYEETLANYFIGREADVSTNGGGLVIIRGATGSGKTSGIKRALELASDKLKKTSFSSKIDPIFLNFNNIATFDTDEEQDATLYIWQEFATAIDSHIGDVSTGDSLDFLQWLNAQGSMKNHMVNIFRFFEKNAEYLRGIKSGSGFGKHSVADLKTIVVEDWRASFDSFSNEELAKHKIARLRYIMDTAPDNATHRVVIIDNVDHLPPRLQNQIVDNSIWLTEFLGVRLLIAVRPLTWENQHGHKTLDVEEHLAPSLADVLCSRLQYVIDFESATTEEVRAIRWLIDELRDDRSHLRNLVYGSSGVSIRAALRNFHNFLSSPLLDGDHESLKPSVLARAFFVGGEQSIDHDNIDDIFSVQNVRNTHVSLLKPRILDYVIRTHGGRVSLIDLFEFIKCFGFSETEIVRAIDELMLRKRSIIWSNMFHKLGRRTAVRDQALIAISPIGASYYSRLFGEYLYTEACLASNRREIISASDVIEFSRRIILEDEEQISNYLSCRSAADYYSVYGLEFPSISFGYWKKFERGAVARQKGRYLEQTIFDPGWESRIRGFLQGKTGKRYLEAQKA